MTHQEAAGAHAVEKYLLGELPGPERDAFEEHFFDCQECAEDVRAGVVFAANTRAVFAEEERRSPTTKEPASRAVPFAWFRPWFALPAAAAAACLALAIYQGAWIIPELRNELAQYRAPQAYPAFFLRLVARGHEQVFPLSRSQPFAGFSLDLPPEAGYPGYECEIAGQSGSFTVPAAAPTTAGAPLNLLVPVRLLPPGRYTLILRGRSGASSVELNRYGFLIELK